MSTIRKYHQGDKVPFGIRFSSTLNPDIQSFADIDEVYVYVYTHPNNKIRFCNVPKQGYYGLLNMSDYLLAGYIPATITAKMTPGAIYCEVMCKEEVDTGVNSIKTGAVLFPSLIKAEL